MSAWKDARIPNGGRGGKEPLGLPTLPGVAEAKEDGGRSAGSVDSDGSHTPSCVQPR